MGASRPLPGQGPDQVPVGDHAAVIEVSAQFQGALGQVTLVESVLGAVVPGPLPPGGSPPARGLGRAFMPGESFLPVPEKGAHEVVGLTHPAEQLGLALLEMGRFVAEEVRVGFPCPLPEGGLGPARLEVVEEFARQIDIGAEELPTGVQKMCL